MDLRQIEIVHGGTRFLQRQVDGVTGGAKLMQTTDALLEHHPVGHMADTRQFNGVIEVGFSVVAGSEHHCSGPVGNQGAIVQTQWRSDHRVATLARFRQVEDRLGGSQLVDVRYATGAKMRQWILDTIAIVQGADMGQHDAQLLGRELFFFLVSLTQFSKQTGEGHTLVALFRPVGATGQRMGHTSGIQGVHFLDTNRQHIFEPAGGYRIGGIVDGQRGGGTGSLGAGGGLEQQPFGINLQRQRPDVLLVHEQRWRTGTDPNGIDVLCFQPGIGDGAGPRLCQQFIKGFEVLDFTGFTVAFDERTKLAVIRTNNTNLHNISSLLLQTDG